MATQLNERMFFSTTDIFGQEAVAKWKWFIQSHAQTTSLNQKYSLRTIIHSFKNYVELLWYSKYATSEFTIFHIISTLIK